MQRIVCGTAPNAFQSRHSSKLCCQKKSWAGAKLMMKMQCDKLEIENEKQKNDGDSDLSKCFQDDLDMAQNKLKIAEHEISQLRTVIKRLENQGGQLAVVNATNLIQLLASHPTFVQRETGATAPIADGSHHQKISTSKQADGTKVVQRLVECAVLLPEGQVIQIQQVQQQIVLPETELE